jgi:putative flippase GtrA
MILLFVASSLVAMVIDYIALLSFSALTRDMAQSLLISVVAARILSSLVNYFITCKLVFEHRSIASIVRYYVLVAGILAVNYGLMVLTSIGSPCRSPRSLWKSRSTR